MSKPHPDSPPNTPDNSGRPFSSGFQSPTSGCLCGSLPVGSLSANTLADTLKVSPLYKQQDSARWSAAAQAYRSSRAHSPTQDEKFSFEPIHVCAEPAIPQKIGHSRHISTRTPLSLEDIGSVNRRRHEMEGGVLSPIEDDIGPLELEAIAAVHELATEVEDISVSEMLPRTSDLIFVNVKTQEGQPYTLELTMKGWRIASSHTDCMNGDYTKVDLHIHYYQNARELLQFISPDHTTRFNECVAERLNQLVEGQAS
ncbi:unnamed protein product [Caenorhabditis auriculariae]|uniref:GSKIP domain-containing protein n=1 Tax=Caenorhabditis auriculariae TaxID=2777116 RepID=A0A8S1HEQ8_9PELO|nr:unnamed protein product [Caenorhabditis auriculariae]